MKTATRGRLSPEQLRNGEPGLPGLATLGLSESPVWIDGFQFTPHTTPRAAVDSYFAIKGVMPTRFYIDPSTAKFNLSHL